MSVFFFLWGDDPSFMLDDPLWNALDIVPRRMIMPWQGMGSNP
jgi:hypothetical protein